jgi:hypothetical protein
MNHPNPTPNSDSFDSRDCALFISDEPGDSTVRPARPEVVARHNAERERLKKLGFNLDGTPIDPPRNADAK